MSGHSVTELSHPLVAHHLTILRDIKTPTSLFRQQIQRLSMLLAVEVSRDLPLRPCRIQTPIQEMEGSELATQVALVPILRAGLGLVDPLLQLIPDASVWHLGMYRDEATAEPIEYYCKLPEANAPSIALVLDPMLATGGSIRMAVGALKRWGVPDIRVLSVIGTQFGINKLLDEFPDVRVWVAKIDDGLNSQNFIVPGLGDAGDRIFNTARN
jgi:uracil phosphoribosyltransferase